MGTPARHRSARGAAEERRDQGGAGVAGGGCAADATRATPGWELHALCAAASDQKGAILPQGASRGRPAAAAAGPRPPARPLLLAEGLDRVQQGGLARRVVAEEQAR